VCRGCVVGVGGALMRLMMVRTFSSRFVSHGSRVALLL
jgi:hypothetical protein